MLNVHERIAQYSGRDLEGIRKGVDSQRKRLFKKEVYRNIGSVQPLLMGVLEAVVGKGTERLQSVTTEDVVGCIKIERGIHRMEVLDLLAGRIDLEARRRSLLGVAR